MPPRVTAAASIRQNPSFRPRPAEALSPCTPLGCIILSKSVHASLEGMNAIVIGRSNLVGRPLIQLLLNENATVTSAHSRSRDLAQLCARADLVYAAVGKPEMVRGDWIKPGAVVIDVGVNRSIEELQNWRGRDPVGRLAAALEHAREWSPARHTKLIEEIDAEIEMAWDRAMADPWPQPEALLDRVYSSGGGRQ